MNDLASPVSPPEPIPPIEAGTLAPIPLHARFPSLAALACLGLMLVLPFQFWVKTPPIPSFYAEALAGGLGLLAMTLALPFVRHLPLPRIVWLPLGFAFLLVGQMLTGRLTFAQQGLLGALYLLWAAGLIVLAAQLRRQYGLERLVRPLAWFLLAGALISALIGIAQFTQHYGIFGAYIVVSSNARVWGNLAQPNHLADYLALGLASIALLFAVRAVRTWLALPLALLVVYVLLLTGSRTALLYLLALPILAGWLMWRQPGTTARRLLVFGLTTLFTFYALPPVLGALLPGSLPDAINSLGRLQGVVFSSEERIAIWRGAWQIFTEAPWFGHGFRQFGYAYFLTAPTLPPPRIGGFNDNAHSLLLSVLAEFGLIGLVVLLLAVVPWVVRLFRGTPSPEQWWLMSVAAILFTHSLLEYPLWYAFFLGIAALVLGLGEGGAVESRAVFAGPRSLRWSAAAMVVLGWVTLSQLTRDYRLLESFLAQRHRYVSTDESVNRQAKEMLLDVHRRSLLAPLVELGLTRTIHLDRDHLDDKIAVNDRAMRVFPVDDVVYRQAILLALRGDHEAATRQWDRAVVAFPAYEREAIVALRSVREQGLAGLDPLLQHVERVQHAEVSQH